MIFQKDAYFKAFFYIGLLDGFLFMSSFENERIMESKLFTNNNNLPNLW